MRLTFVYLDGSVRVPTNKVALWPTLSTDLPLGLGCIRSFAAADPDLGSALQMTNRTYKLGATHEGMLEDLLATEPELVAFSCFIWNADRMFRLAAALKTRRPEVKVVFGGAHVPRDMPGLRRFMEAHPFVDIGVSGEGEETFVELLKNLLAGKALNGMAGVAFRGPAGLEVGFPRPWPNDLDRIPSPYASGHVSVAEDGEDWVLFESSRGCPLTCGFCDYHTGRHNIRAFSIDRIRRDFEVLRERRFKGTLFFTDPIMNFKRDHFKQVLALCRDWPHKIFLNIHPEMFDDEAIELVGQVPKPWIVLGIQSIHEPTMRNIQRRYHIDIITRNISKLLSYPNVQVGLELILGLPGDDYESFRRSVDWAYSFERLPNLFTYDLWVVENAPLYGQQKQFGIVSDDEGLVLANSTFSVEDMRKGSLLCAVINDCQADGRKRERLEKMMKASRLRPSEVIEKVAQGYVKNGVFTGDRVKTL